VAANSAGKEEPTMRDDATDPLTGFLRQADREPEATAVVDGADRWTYGQLADAGRDLADRLARAGVPPRSLVGLSVTRGWRVVAGILGVWLRGSAYVPIDPEYPARRREYVVRDAGVSTVVTDGPDGGFAVVPGYGAPVPDPLPADLAYVIYTSGSTGEPKGVLVGQANLRALFTSCAAVLPAGPQDVGTVFHSHCFDFSVWEIWRLLTVGGCAVFVPAGARTDPRRFAQLLAEHRVTLLNLVPSVFGNLVRALHDDPVQLPRLREVILGGEAVDLDAVRAWFRLGVAPRARLVNMYGITETTVHVTAKPLDPDQVDAFRGPGTPIGRPLPHLRVTVVGDDGAEVPVGATGEMYVAGAGVASGYLGRPELTAQRFTGPEGDTGPATRGWYRTGDLARREADGELSYLGRRDGQIQLRGYRIEPGEVEAALRELPGVAAAGVAAVPNRQGEPVLVACYVPAGPDPSPPTQLRAELRDRLPGYMVPARLVAVDRLSVTPEGKLDRAAVAATVDRAAPRGRWPTLVAEVWAEVLGYHPTELSTTDDFFELGGHSLAADRVVARLGGHTATPVAVRLLFDHPVLADFATAVRRHAGPRRPRGAGRWRLAPSG
jgi:nonribosomal peptide synthetase DhbF